MCCDDILDSCRHSGEAMVNTSCRGGSNIAAVDGIYGKSFPFFRSFYLKNESLSNVMFFVIHAFLVA